MRQGWIERQPITRALCSEVSRRLASFFRRLVYDQIPAMGVPQFGQVAFEGMLFFLIVYPERCTRSWLHRGQ
jgi:hypothetical protein